MHRKLLFIAFVLMFVVASSITGCGTAEDAAPDTDDVVSVDDPQADLPEVTMTIGHTNPADPTQHVHAGALAFKDYVERESQGKITVTIVPAGGLGDSASLQEQVMLGEIEGVSDQTEGALSIVYPNIQVLAIPYLFDYVDQALEVFRGEFGEKLYEDCRQKTGMRTIAVWDNGGFRCFTNSIRPIRNPDDMDGLMMRTMEIPAHMEMVSALGANPVPVPWGELYSALETGVVDGQENAIPTIIMGSVYEVQDYLVLDNHVYSQEHFMINDAWFSDLPQLYQDIILRGGEKAEQAGARATRVQREVGLELLGRHMEIYNPTAEEIALFREATQEPVIEYIRASIDNPELVDEILQAAQEALERMGYTQYR